MAEVIKYRGRLQFITHQTEQYSTLEGAEMALEGGCRWVQLRMKGVEAQEVLKVGKELRRMCDKYDATLIIDDHVEIVKELKADGVHLGLTDMPVAEARRHLGEEFLIGGTANTAEQAINHCRMGADYLGCGPFRFTHTKQNLAPVLGLDGYAQILQRLDAQLLKVPLVAIGGIRIDDVDALIDVGVSGIAVSSGILQAADPINATQQLVRKLNNAN